MKNLSKLLLPEIQEFIIKNTDQDAAKLSFGKNPFPEVDYKLILNQIAARNKSKTKLPTWFNCINCVYPSKISVEQTSSEITAKYKVEIVSGASLIDLSGGFGVDDYYFAKKIKHVYHCEINPELSAIVKHNFIQLNCNNITCIEDDSTETLKNLNQQFDWIYVDPSRRNDIKGKVFMLNDCLPNIPDLQSFYYQFSSKILIKTAPLLDITAGLTELQNVKHIHIVAVDNEVKELLWELHQDYTGNPTIKCINFNKNNTETFEYLWNLEVDCSYGAPKKYLYEPNSSILKSGGFIQIANQFSLDKLHVNSHLYTSDNLIDFPGRVFNIESKLNYSKKEIKEHLENTKLNVTVRNFPETVESIRKKWKIKDGGDRYCFFTTDINNNKIVLLCTKINTL
jgi:hypothetical protein